MQTMLNDIKYTKSFCYPTIMDLMSDFIYREKRYKTNFSIAFIYSDNAFADGLPDIQKGLRMTDKMTYITYNLLFVIFDYAQEDSYVKAAENLFKTLGHDDYHQKYYIATSYSQDFDENYLNMINVLFERLEYSVTHNLANTVNEQDYVI